MALGRYVGMSQDLPDPSLEPLDILLVEDDPHLRESLREVLEEEGYRVQAVPSGTEAISLSANRRFDLIVTDIKTPGSTDGLSALEKVKEGNPEVAGIVITGYSNEEFALRAAKLKVENYLKKPFDIEDFLLTVDRLAAKKRHTQSLMAKELLAGRALRWLAIQLLAEKTERTPEDVEQFSRSSVAATGIQCRDTREQLNLETVSLLRLLALHGLVWPAELQQVFSGRIAQALLEDDEPSLGGRLLTLARDYQAGRSMPSELSESASEDDSEGLRGSLLNVALLLESAERFHEARTAFEDLLNGSGDPFDRYPAHFGLARLARIEQRWEELEAHLRQAVVEGSQLGPMTHSQALTERGLMLASVGSRQAQAALREAWEFTRGVKDTGSFALVSLALEHFLGQPTPKRSRLLAYLSQPEHFALAGGAGDWLLSLLLGLSELEPEEQRFLGKLVRAGPAAFERMLCQTDHVVSLTNALSYLEILAQDRQQRVLRHYSGIDSPELAKSVARWTSANRSHAREATVLRVFSFSGIRLYRDDEALEIKRKKPLLLLLYLLYRNSPVGEEHLLELFWPGDESKARASLRTTLSYLRKLLSPEGEVDPLLRHAGGLVVSEQLSVWFDFREFDLLIRRGKSLIEQSPERATECFRSAVRLYRGPFLENVYEDWALEVREQAEVAFEQALSYLATTSMSASNWAAGYEYAGRGLRRDPLSQPFCEMTMQALLGLGRPHDALQVFEQCKTVLRQELDLEPSIEMIRYREMAKLGI